MKIKHIYLENFNNIKKLDLNLDHKINLIIGKNGGGKSSFNEALIYPSLNYLNKTIEEYINWHKDSAIINQQFSFMGKEYDFQCKFDKIGAHKSIVFDGNEKEKIEGSKNWSEYIRQFINPTLTLYSSVSLQGESRGIIFEDPPERLKRLKTIFGMDRISRIVELIKKDIKDNKDKLNILDAEIKTLEGRTFEFENEYVLEDVSEIKRKYNELLKLKNVYDKEVSLYNEYKNQLDIYKRNIFKKEEYEDSIKFQNNLLKECLKKRLPLFDEVKYNELKNKIQTLENEKIIYENKIENINKLKKEKEELENSIREKEIEINTIVIEKIDSPLKYTSKNLENIKSEIVGIRTDIAENKNFISLANEGKCPTCKKEFISDISILYDKEKELVINLRELEEKEKIISEYISNTTKIILQNETRETLKLNIEKDLNNFKNKLNETQTAITYINFIERDFIKEIETLKNKFNELHKVKETYGEVVEFNREVESKQNLINEKIKFFEDKIIKECLNLIEPVEVKEPILLYNENELQSLYNQIIIYDQKEKELNALMQRNKDKKDEQKKVLKLIEEKYKDKQKISQENLILNDSQILLDKEFSSHLIETGITFLSHEMNDFFNKVYGRYIIKIEQSKKSVDFLYSDLGDKFVSVRSASGFEKQVIGAAFKSALCRLQPDFNLLVLDEIDSDSKSDNSIRLFSNLIEKGGFEQIFIITHKDETQEFLINNYNANVIDMDLLN